MTLATEPDHPVLLRALSLGMTPSVAKDLSAANIIAMGGLLNDDVLTAWQLYLMKLEAHALLIHIACDLDAVKTTHPTLDFSTLPPLPQPPAD